MTSLVALLGFWVSLQAFADAKLVPPSVEVLSNGLRVAWVVDDSLPVVEMGFLFFSGYRDDPDGKSGVAELAVRLLDRGAGGKSAAQISRSVESLGAARSAGTGPDSISVGVRGLEPDADALLAVLADIALRPTYDSAELKREQERVGDVWHRQAELADALAELAMQRVQENGTDYFRASLLSLKELRGISRSDLVSWHRTHFTPKNSLFMVVGRVDRAEFRKKIEAALGDWQGEAPKRNWKKRSQARFVSRPGEVLLVDRPGLTQAQLRIGMPGPLAASEESSAASVANAILGETFNSRLNSVLRDQLALTYAVGSGVAQMKGLAQWRVSSSTRNEMIGTLLDKTHSILDELASGKISDDEVAGAKEYLTGGFPLAVSSLSAVASRWLAGEVLGLGAHWLTDYLPRVQAARKEEVAAVFRRYLASRSRRVVIVGDAKALGPLLRRSVSAKRVRVLSAKDLLE